MARLPTEDGARKALPMYTYLMEYFPDAFLAELGVAVAGNVQHNGSASDIRWAREKSTDQMNTALRHIFDYGTGTRRDTDGQWHLAKAIWRLKAQLQLDIEAEREEAELEAFSAAMADDEPPFIPDEVLYTDPRS